ncbi:helix-turn-helix transcriptional regulator [Tomitella fengzijianii]|uniref:Helix-turn-helix domain-containing protein n=1 Tax=Tomitella fengzijianii TaxID=2597660 RepID=A0A516X4H3_9ACTN|nr:helix-turn-helix domain-containing protein [Tomitella fengzijianii]QDQ97950.1 helix-turn-helix domain-containing protein [Tomitella fengzijianii]
MTLLTYAEVGERLNCSPWSVAKLTRRGELPRIVLSPRQHRVDEADLHAFIKDRKESTR